MNQYAPDIRRPELIDAEWMTAALSARGIDTRITSIEATPIGTGQIGECFRFRLEHSDPAAPGPRSLVGKFASRHPESFQIGLTIGDYERELQFYRVLAKNALVAVPECYLAERDAETGQFVLLLEDLAPARQGDQLTGVSLEQARLVVDEAAKLHASHWNDSAIAEHAWIRMTPKCTQPQPSPDSIRLGARGFCERYSGQLSDGAVATCLAYAERVERHLALPQKHKCLVHLDFRPDNMMFSDEPGVRPVTIVDWQTLGQATTGDDLAYFLAGALDRGQLAGNEAELLARYLGQLQALGVRDYTQADLENDYALGGFRLLAVAMGGAMAVKRTERGDRMFVQMAQSAVAHILAFGALDRLG